MRTCSVKRPRIDRIYNVRVVLRVPPTPQRGKGVGKERGSHEGENLRDRVRGCKSLTLVPLVLSLVNIDRCIDSNSEPEKCYPTKRTIGSLTIAIRTERYNRSTLNKRLLYKKRNVKPTFRFSSYSVKIKVS